MLKWFSYGVWTCACAWPVYMFLFKFHKINLTCTYYFLFSYACLHKQEIEEVDTDEHYQPKTPIGIMNIILKQEP